MLAPPPFCGLWHLSEAGCCQRRGALSASRAAEVVAPAILSVPGATLRACIIIACTVDCCHTHIRSAVLCSWWTLVLHRVHDFGEEEFHLRRDRPSWIGLLNQVKAFVHRGEPEIAVEQVMSSASISARAANSFIASRYLGEATSTISESLE